MVHPPACAIRSGNTMGKIFACATMGKFYSYFLIFSDQFVLLETGISHLQISFISRCQHGDAHLHVRLTGDKPLSIGGKTDQVPFPSHLYEGHTHQQHLPSGALRSFLTIKFYFFLFFMFFFIGMVCNLV